jgi:cytochrome c peroxidase
MPEVPAMTDGERSCERIRRASSSMLEITLLLSALAGGCGSSATTTRPDSGGVRPDATTSGCNAVLSEDECRSLAGMLLPVELPAAHGNAFADDARAAELGYRLFYDRRLSSNAKVGCVTCHAPEKQFQDGEARSTGGLGPVPRNSQSVSNAARHRWLFWDGRADSLWSQSIFPVEDASEMNITRLELAHKIKALFADRYEPVFGPLPPLEDAARFPPRGRPGDPAFDGMAEADRDAVNRVAANFGKAIEAAERRMVSGRSAFDRWLLGETAALDAAKTRGLVAFVRGACTTCHSGPLFSDDLFHDVGLPGDDRGRAAGIERLLGNSFNGLSAYYDGPRPDDLPASAGPGDERAFRTPSLRNLARTAPYGHDGSLLGLREAILAHTRPAPVSLSPAEMDDLVEFLAALTGDAPPPPWNDWPHY